MIKATVLLLGIWRATLMLPDAELPFNFEIKRQNDTIFIELINGTERIRVDDIQVKGDSVIIMLPVFDTELRVQSVNGLMRGHFINYTRKQTHIPFEARYNEAYRFATSEAKMPGAAEGRYAVQFSPGTADSSFAVGLFERNGNKATGTFMTESGDYRFLEGAMDGDSLKLSCFDGVHLFLFRARFTNDSLYGVFYSGNHWKENWVAVKNKSAELRDADHLTLLKPGFTRPEFQFPDTDSNMVSFSDMRFRNKVCMIIITGSWCPNCMDEARFLAGFYPRYKDLGFEVLALSFEKWGDFAKARQTVLKAQKQLNVTYPFLIAGTASRENVLKSLPMLQNFKGYPTSIIVDKKGNIRKIHTGFKGPATGAYYDKFADDFERFIQQLIAE